MFYFPSLIIQLQFLHWQLKVKTLSYLVYLINNNEPSVDQNYQSTDYQIQPEYMFTFFHIVNKGSW